MVTPGRFVIPARDGYRPHPVSTRAQPKIMLTAAALVALGGSTARAQPVRPGEAPIPRPPATTPDQGTSIQPPEELQAFEGRPIRKVILQRPMPRKEPSDPVTYGPLGEELAGLVMNQLRAIPGTPYRQETVTEDITRLTRVSRFKQIENRVQLLDDGSVNLIYTLVPQPIVLDVQAVGNRRLTDQDIAKEVDILKGTSVDRYQLDRACRRIENLYREKGYYLAQVTVDERALEDSGIVLFRVREGERLKVTDIRFEGNRSFSPRELRSAIKTTEANLLEKGALDDDMLDLDVASLIEFYKDRGYLDARVGRTYRPSLNGREAIVTFQIEEGRLYTLRNVTLYYPDRRRPAEYPTAEQARAAAGPGEHVIPRAQGVYHVYSMGVFSPEQVVGLMKLKPGDVYSQNLIRRSLQSVRSAYGEMGYLDARVVPVELRDIQDPRVDLLLEITEGNRFRTGEVIIRGNDITRDRVIRKHVLPVPDRPANSVALDESRRRLNATRLFDIRETVRLTYQDPDPLDPTYRDLLVEVKETNTGRFLLGASVGSDLGVAGRISLEQDNFDVSDTPDSFDEFFSGRAFRGGAQKFKIEILPGNDFSTYQISLGEPSLFESDYSGNIAGYYRIANYDEFSEDRLGTRFGFGRAFGSRWTINFPFRIENINLRNVDPDEAVDILEFEGDNLLTGIGVVVGRSTLNDAFRPTAGRQIELGIEQVGAMGGDFTFTSFRAEHRLYIPIHEDFLGRRTVFNWKSKIGYIPQDKDDVPVYERFYLGGQSFRGFDFRAVSPIGLRSDGTSSGDPVGGTWMFFTGVEISQPVYQDVLSLVGFVDTGTVSYDAGFDDYRVSVGFGLRLYFPGFSPAPLAFDFGFPILRESTDDERVFTFAIDIPFNY